MVFAEDGLAAAVAGDHVGHGQGAGELAGRVAAIVFDEIDFQGAGAGFVPREPTCRDVPFQAIGGFGAQKALGFGRVEFLQAPSERRAADLGELLADERG